MTLKATVVLQLQYDSSSISLSEENMVLNPHPAISMLGQFCSNWVALAHSAVEISIWLWRVTVSASIAEYFPEKSRWCSHEQVCWGVTCECSKQCCGLVIALYKVRTMELVESTEVVQHRLQRLGYRRQLKEAMDDNVKHLQRQTRQLTSTHQLISTHITSHQITHYTTNV